MIEANVAVCFCCDAAAAVLISFFLSFISHMQIDRVIGANTMQGAEEDDDSSSTMNRQVEILRCTLSIVV